MVTASPQQPFSAALGSGHDWRTAAKACLAGLGPIPPLLPGCQRLGLAYLTDGLADDAGSIITLLRGVTGVRDWVGTVGFGVCTSGRALFDQPAVSVLIGTFAPDSLQLLNALGGAGSEGVPVAPQWAGATTAQLGLVHVDPRFVGLGPLLPSLADAAGGFLIGGISSSRGAMPQFGLGPDGGAVVDGGVSGVLFSQRVSLATGLTQGCTPIGPLHQVTEADGNVVKALDGQPALELFKREIGAELAHDLRGAAGEIYAALPVAGSDTADYRIRALVGFNPGQGWLVIGDQLEPGQTLRFARRDGASARADLLQMVLKLKGRLAGPARGALYISCNARGADLFDDDDEELRLIAETLGPVPLTGFYASGEIFRDQLYGYTGILTLFA